MLGSYLMAFSGAIAHTGCMLRLTFCEANTINHYFCDILPLLQLSCTSTYISWMQLWMRPHLGEEAIRKPCLYSQHFGRLSRVSRRKYQNASSLSGKGTRECVMRDQTAMYRTAVAHQPLLLGQPPAPGPQICIQGVLGPVLWQSPWSCANKGPEPTRALGRNRNSDSEEGPCGPLRPVPVDTARSICFCQLDKTLSCPETGKGTSPAPHPPSYPKHIHVDGCLDISPQPRARALPDEG
ncbi:Olfactory receptor 8B4 [Plecturocebus cupreus]